MLNKLFNKKSLTILGLNSGTSADAVDMAVVKINRSKKQPSISYITGGEYKFSPRLKEAILRVADNRHAAIDEVLKLDTLIGDFIGRKANSFIKKLSINNIKIDLIASHGQTICHLPNEFKLNNKNQSGSHQLGSPAQIAQHTGKIVVADFRQADIALGGEGAPITTGAMARLFAEYSPTLIVNIGGMSNYFLLPSKKNPEDTKAADCGPGNVLIDLLMKKLYHKNYDKNGKTASSGTISKELLDYLVKYSSKLKNKSTGRELFGLNLADDIIRQGHKFNLSIKDIIATTTEYTVLCISASISRLIKKDSPIKKLYLTGGGRKNIFLYKRLQNHLNQLTVAPIDQLGINGDFIEAAAYAVMGEAALRSQSLGFYKHRVKPILGSISQPPLEQKRK